MEALIIIGVITLILSIIYFAIMLAASESLFEMIVHALFIVGTLCATAALVGLSDGYTNRETIIKQYVSGKYEMKIHDVYDGEKLVRKDTLIVKKF